MGELDVERDGDTVTLTLNRPDKRNALSAGLVAALHEQVDAAYGDGTRLLVIRGEGRNLSAGFDFTGYEEEPEASLLHRFVRIELLLQALWHAPFHTVALAHGRNFGAGADLFVACEGRVAAPDATFRFPGLAFGLVLGTRRLAARTDEGWARRTLRTLRTVDAAEAAAAGMVTDVVETDSWQAHLATDAETLPWESRKALTRVLASDTGDADLADLVRSAVAPGLVDRIRRFREAT